VLPFFDLESQLDINRLQNPQLMLGSLRGLVVIDEIQAMPGLFRVLRVLADRPGNKTRFLILGSASPDLVNNVSETPAGRVEFVELSGFGLCETGSGSSSETPKITKSMNQALESLNLTHLWVIYPGEHSYPLSKQVSVWPMKNIVTLPKQLG
jgi:predicted AAA+ superfamily ATPase